MVNQAVITMAGAMTLSRLEEIKRELTALDAYTPEGMDRLWVRALAAARADYGS